MKGYRNLLALIALLPTFAATAMEPLFERSNKNPGAKPASAERYTAECYRVVDGDSLYLKGLETQIRLWGVDAPERDEPGYEAARNSLRRLALGRELRCETKDIDKYDRIVARCFDAVSGLELNREQIRRKVAKEYCYFTQNYYGYCRQ